MKDAGNTSCVPLCCRLENAGSSEARSAYLTFATIMLCPWRVKLKLLLATVTLVFLISWLYLFMGNLELEWEKVVPKNGPRCMSGLWRA